ncbi:MAG: DUF4861 family protein [Candidatus Sumerlaeia bacterium]
MDKFCRLLAVAALFAAAAQSHGATYEELFGKSTIGFDAARLAEVKAATPGARFWYDTNADGKIDEVWFIDTDPRHTGKYSPILVKCIDRDGDLAVGIEGDHDSDLYIIDWYANGTMDRAVEFEDYDHDGDMDMMAEYINGSPSSVLWAHDTDDDNLLWWDRDYTYYQTPCQDHCHFEGERTWIISFDATRKMWVPGWESPFFFIDNDKDGVGDEVVRLTVNPSDTIVTLRWSFNVKGIGSLEDPRNYDCSISAYPVAGTKIQGAVATSATLQGYPITPMLSYENGRPWLRSVKWQKGCFTWVENDNNVGWNDRYTAERWEGVIGHGSANFTQIGGPSCGPYNNRNEIDLNPTGPFEYYFNPADHRIHLKSANEAWLAVDWDGDFKQDMRYDYSDTNGDGVLDMVAFDPNNDGVAEDFWTVAADGVQPLAYDWKVFRDAYAPVLRDYPAQLYELDRALAAALESVSPGSSSDAVWSLIENKFAASSIPAWKRLKFLGSDQALIYYLELVRDRQIVKLKAQARYAYTFWDYFNQWRAKGDAAVMAALVRGQFGLTPDWAEFSGWIGGLRRRDVQGVDSSSAWLPDGIAWETERAAWRVRKGRFDFLGKREKRLVLDGIAAGADISTDTGGWGMDALDEGTGGGAGGLILFIDNVAYALYGDAPTSATYRLVEQTNDRVTVEMLVRNAGPASAPRTVRVRSTALAGRADTRFEATIEGGPAGDLLELGIGLARPRESYFEHRRPQGILGIWGFQTPAIDWVGLGLLYPAPRLTRTIETPADIIVVLSAEQGRPVEWAIANDWRRGRRFPNYPVLSNWMDELGRIGGINGLTRNAAQNWTVMR